MYKKTKNMKKIKKILIVLTLSISTIFTIYAVGKQTELVYHYSYTTSCGTYHTTNSKTQLTQSQISTWHATCEFFGGCL
jgi:disulfide bond formation protein DsbB